LFLTKNREANGLKKWSWAIFNTVLGLPGVFSFMLLNPKKTKLLNQDKSKGDINV